jgi:3-phosphoshikimate 1-carboxyvinyltransferase
MNAHPSSKESGIVSLTPLKSQIQAEVTIPGSKSYTIRGLILAAMAEKPNGQPVRVWNPLRSDDGQAVMNCLKALGIQILWGEEGGQSYVDVSGQVQRIADADYTLHADLSAATLRFLVALSAVIPGRQTLLGQEGLNRRPVKDLVDALRKLGVSIDYLEQEGYPPVRVNSSVIQANRLTVSGATSSQYISALMMIAPLIDAAGEAIVIELPEAPVSKPYLDMTLDIMQAFGVTASHENHQKFVIAGGQQYQTVSYTVEPDASSAAYFAAIATLTHSTITLKNMNPQSVQADMRFIEILKQMGTYVHHIKEGDLVIEGHGVKPLHVDMCDCPDQAQALAVLAAFANGTTRIDGLQSLRVKETDRIAAVEAELEKMGVPVEAKADALIIQSGNPKAARIATYGDHRMAMAFAVAGAVLEGLEIEDPAVVNKTYPGFWQDLSALGVGVRKLNANASKQSNAQKIVLIGFMGAGKSSVAKILSERHGLTLIEMDDLIVQQSGRQSVPEIFDRDGETQFRKLEAQVAQSLENQANVVISTGGGVIGNPDGMNALAENAKVIWLDTQLGTVLERLGDNLDRPLLRDLDKASQLYEQRLARYEQTAHHRIVTDDLTPQAVADEIARIIPELNTQTICSV